MSDHGLSPANVPFVDSDGTSVTSPDYALPGGASTPTPAEGTRRYRSVRLHARGALGQVHVARDEELNREVALKELQDHCADLLDNRLRFFREAEITAGLEHPSIVPVYSRGYHPGGRPYYTMRLVRGDSLETVIDRLHAARRGRKVFDTLAFRDLLTRFVTVCQAAAYAHSRGVIHRDLKPGNILVGAFGETMVVDWGLARHYDQPDNDLDPTPLPHSVATDSSATQEGQIIGTPAYMSPEQAAGRKDLMPATDIYSLGGILYRILTGQPPLPRAAMLVTNTDRTPPRPRSLNPFVPAPLEAVCLKAMETSTDARYTTADELAREVQRWLADEPVNARAEPFVERAQRWARRHRTAMTGLAALLITATLGLGIGLAAVSREQARTAEQRDEARDAGERAARNFQRAEKALIEAKLGLQEADRNLLLARKAVDECFVLTSNEPALRLDGLAPFRRRLLKAALPYYREFQSRRPGDTAFDLDYARSMTRVASIEASLGDHADAREQVEKALKLCAAIEARGQLDDAALQELADCINDLGSVLHELKDLDRAVSVVEKGRALQERLVNHRPGDFRAAHHLTKMTHNLGLIESARGRGKEALKWYDRAIALEQALLVTHPDDVALLGDHVASWRGKAGLLDADKWHDEAHAAYRSGEEAGERLLRLGGTPSADAIRNVATTYSDHGASRSNQGKPSEALPLLQKAIAFQERLCQQHPDALFLKDLGTMTSNLGTVCFLLRRPDDELAAWEKARRTWAELLSRRPKDDETRKKHDEAFQRLTRSRIFRVDRHIKATDAVAASRAIEALAADVYPPLLLGNAAVCGRWLSAFEKDEKVSASQREQVKKQALAFLAQAKRVELDEKTRQMLRTEKSFDALRDEKAFQELIAQ